jgi:hypothetical protein
MGNSTAVSRIDNLGILPEDFQRLVAEVPVSPSTFDG